MVTKRRMRKSMTRRSGIKRKTKRYIKRGGMPTGTGRKLPVPPTGRKSATNFSRASNVRFGEITGEDEETFEHEFADLPPVSRDRSSAVKDSTGRKASRSSAIKGYRGSAPAGPSALRNGSKTQQGKVSFGERETRFYEKGSKM